MKHILVPTDFTGTSNLALAWAKFIAKHYINEGHETTLVLAHVTQPIIPDTTLPTGEVGAGILAAQEMEDVGELNLQELAEQLEREGFSTRIENRFGSIDDEIVEVADELQPDLIVMGRSHVDSFFDWLAGSSAADVAMTAHCPVLVVPTLEHGENQPVRLENIVYATQLEFDENHILRPVVQLARTFQSKLRLVKIKALNQPDVYDDRQFLDQIEAEFGRERFVEDTVDANNVKEGLTKYNKTHQVDLLIMATRERDFLSKLLNPSLTKRMVLSSDIPVLVYHAKENY
ncbi:universal stress protein [Larkinella humicola]|uniref:Universal stress protein n=1 Tax=Larkinella humicola TaxID=2607654 RepID=A0A5N1JUU6_9BACT|nr:universal stress protein [Larkinella humicola]KAA9357543.1 universal stress protein [Larkinella humicola]